MMIAAPEMVEKRGQENYQVKIVYENMLAPKSSAQRKQEILIPLVNPRIYKASGEFANPDSLANGKAIARSLSIDKTHFNFRNLGVKNVDSGRFEIGFDDIELCAQSQGTLYLEGKWAECNALGRVITANGSYAMYGNRGHRTILGGKELRHTSFLDIDGDVALYFIGGNRTGKIVNKREDYRFENGDSAYIGFRDGLGDYNLTLYFRNDLDTYACTLKLSSRDYYDLFDFNFEIV